jgi:gliding motility-associated-like protein
LAVFDLQGSAPADAVSVEWSWTINPNDVGVLLLDPDDDYVVAISMTQAGVYQLKMEVELADGTICSAFYDREIFPLAEIQSNVQSSYSLCNSEVETIFSVTNPEDFTSVNWVIGVEGQAGFDVGYTFDEVETHELTIIAVDENGCDVRKDIEFEIVDGPNQENTSVSLESSISDLNCLEPATEHQITTSVVSNFSPQSIFWSNTSQTSSVDTTLTITVANIQEQSLVYPIEIQFEDCTVDKELTHSYTVQHEVNYNSTHDGSVLCDGETITLTNTSNQLAWDNNFTWNIEESQIISESPNAITFSYEEDGNYNWTLDYNGQCPSSAAETVSIDVDIIQPQLAAGLNQLSCDNEYTLELNHATELEEGENYTFDWSVISATGLVQNSSVENPSFELTESGTHDVSLTISNPNSGCSASIEHEDFFTLGGIEVLMVEDPVTLCEGEPLNTADLILSDEVVQYEYEWTLEGSGVIEGYSNVVFLPVGTFTYDLYVYDAENDCEIEIILEDFITVNSNPEVYLTTEEPTICELPSAVSFNAGGPEPGDPINTWSWYQDGNLVSQTTGGFPSYEVETPGVYLLQLEVEYESTGCTTEKELEFTANDVDFWLTPFGETYICQDEIYTPHQYIYDDLESAPADFLWSIIDEDGSVSQSSALAEPEFEMSTPGSFDVSLTKLSTINSCEQTRTMSTFIHVNEKPNFELTTSTVDVCELPHLLDVSIITENVPEYPFTNWDWLLKRNGTIYETEFTPGFYSITENGIYEANLTITNSQGCEATDSIEIVANDIGMTFEEEGPGAQCIGYMFAPQDYVTSDPLSEADYIWKLIDESGQDYQSSFVENPMFDIEQSGMYDLSVEVFSEINECVFDTILEDYIEIKPLAVSIETEVTSCSYPIEVTMDYDASLVEESETSFLWTFYDADGFNVLGTSTEQNPTFEYQTEGEFDVELALTDIELGCMAELRKVNAVIIDSVDILLDDSEPFVSPCAPFSFSPSTIDLTEDVNGNYIYFWELIDANGTVVESLNSKEGEIDVNTAGAYDLQLTVINPDAQCMSIALLEDFVLVDDYELELSVVDDNNCFNTTDTVFKTINVDNFSPEYNFDNGALNFDWTVSPNADVVVMSETANQLVIGVITEGEYTISYEGGFDESECTYTDEVEISIGVSPEIVVSNTVCLGSEFPLAENSTIGVGGNTDFLWSSNEAIAILDPTSSTTSFIANELGSHNISLTVTNDLGCTETVSKLIEVYDVQADFSVSETVFQCVPNTVTLTSLNNDQVVGHTWNITENYLSGNANVYTYGSSSVNHAFTSSNSTDIELIIEMQHGCLDTLTQTNNVVVNEFSLDLLDLTDNYCFNGVNSISKDFKTNLLSTYDLPYNIESFTWEMTPSDGVSLLSETDSTSTFAFENAGSYNLLYSIIIDDCVYTDEISFDLGVEASVSVPDVICLGESFSISGEGQINIGSETTYEWTSEQGLSFENADDLFTNIVATQSGDYNVSLTVTNNEGCWVIESHELEVYEVIADFTSPEAGKQCKPAFVGFESLNNDYITDFAWNIYEVSHLGDTTVTSVASVNPEYNLIFNQFATSDVELIVNSFHGCSDTILKEEYIEVVSPLPYVSLEPNWAGCDTIYVDIVDSSSYIDNFNWVDLGLGVILDYEVQDTNTVMYTYPYGETNALFQEYYINLQAEYEGCFAEFNDTVRVYPNPIIDISASDYEGCPPFEVSFEDNSQFAHPDYAEFFWDFGDGSTSTEANPVHTYTETGEYQIYHKVVSPNSCESDTLWEMTIQVFENPVAAFTAYTPDFCYEMGDVYFEDESTHDSDTLTYLWDYVGTGFSDTEQNPTFHYNYSATYGVNLTVEDSHGCVNQLYQEIDVVVLDTEVDEPILNYVSVTDDGVLVEWADTLDDYFEDVSVYHKTFGNWNLVHLTDEIVPNQYFHDMVSTNEVNDYTLVQQDSCGYYSDSSVVHSTILLSAYSPSYQTVNLDWTRYYGWDSVATYDIYRSFDGGEYQWLDQISGDSTSYVDTSLCNVIYGYYVVANHPNDEFQSRSNKRLVEPLFIDFTEPLKLNYTSVIGDEVILTQWETFYWSEMTYYNVDRWDEYFGWVENYDHISEPPYIDNDVTVDVFNYVYRISYADICGNTGPESRVGTNVLLDGTQYSDRNELSWTPYQEWDGGVESYQIQFYNNDLNNYQTLETLDGSTLHYTDVDLSRDGVDTSYCYRIIATSFEGENIRSYSNSRCFVPAPREFFPNAFTPNGDDINDYFEYAGDFAKTMDVTIYNRYGSVVFSSDRVDFAWDGISRITGNKCPQGSYILHYEIEGFDGTKINDQMSIILLR